MKNTIISIILFVLLVTGLTYINNKFTNLCSDLIDKSNEIEKLLDKKELDTAYTKSLELLEYINSKDFIPSIYLNHIDYDDLINECLKLCVYIKREDIAEASASLDLIEFSCEHLIKIQKINLKNIL
ncbi:DUF4363 family protein [Caproiciproducens sp. MSJ-32]|uniref:DUF4363 family protein n=1 Tax=Caproiciproducens sp. MSJ-32 TaxID=2841527 RepID=UPI001C10C376|nr:DUF4363 family protein [Caproiciproducens sp. MSJ-32]MBU5454124.1 DUF4363 family protein [Caproiciproducens sp. MSJ-32]